MNKGRAFIVAVAIAIVAVAFMRPAAAAGVCTVDADCVSPGESCQSGTCTSTACGGSAPACPMGTDCLRGVCLTACSGSSGSCRADQVCARESGDNGHCLPSIPISWPTDYGLVAGDTQPGCSEASDCSPAPRCKAGVCRSQFNGNDHQCQTYNTPNNLACPPFGYTCVRQPVTMMTPQPPAFCERGTCATDAECVTNYPIQGYNCLEGRCTNPCTTDAECNRAGPAGEEQRTCFRYGHANQGRCVRTIGSGRLIPYLVAQPDLARAQQNLVFVAEGYVPTETARFERWVQNALRWSRNHADLTSPHLATDVNIFLLELPEEYTGFGQPTLFGHFKTQNQITGATPGADWNANGASQHALSVFSARVKTLFPAIGGPYNAGAVAGERTVIVFRGFENQRAYGGGIILMLIGDGVGAPPENTYATFIHELGHFMGRLADEYDSDSGSPPPNQPPGQFCEMNVVSRANLTECTICNGPDDVTPPDQTLVPWSPFINDTAIPTTSGDLTHVGLYQGAGAQWKTEAFRSQNACMMRRHGDVDFCAACREGWTRNNLEDGEAKTTRWLFLGNNATTPTSFANGPLRNVAVSRAQHRAFTVAEYDNGNFISVIDGNLGRWRQDVPVPADSGTGVPLYTMVDDAHNRLFLDHRNPSNPATSSLLALDTASLTLSSSRVTIPNLTASVVLVPSAASQGAIYAYTRAAAGAGALAEVDLSSLGMQTLATGTLPLLAGQPQWSPRACAAGTTCPGLVFFHAGFTVPQEPSCTQTSCEIRVFDPATRQFLATALSVDTAGAVSPGIGLLRIGTTNPATGGSSDDILIAVTDTNVTLWQTQAVRAGATPSVTFTHQLGSGVPISAAAYVYQSGTPGHVLVGNQLGRVVAFLQDGSNAPAGEEISIPSATPSMQVLDIQTFGGGYAYVALGGFNGPRDGVIAVLDMQQPAASRVIYEQRVAAMGLATQSLGFDPDRGVLYSNAMLDTEDQFDAQAPFRGILIKGAFRTGLYPRYRPALCGLGGR